MGFRYPDFYSLWSAYETEALKKKHNVDLFRQKVTVQVQMGIWRRGYADKAAFDRYNRPVRLGVCTFNGVGLRS